MSRTCRLASLSVAFLLWVAGDRPNAAEKPAKSAVAAGVNWHRTSSTAPAAARSCGWMWAALNRWRSRRRVW